MKWLLSLLAGLCVISSSARAQEEGPDVLIKKVSEDVLSIVRQDKEIQSGNARKAIELVESKVIPHFNFQRMTALAMGKDWNKATPDQKKRLSDEFRTLLVRTYSNALSGYRDHTVRYKPFKAPGGDADALVRTEILQPGGKTIPIDYSVEKQPDGWKVFDVVVAGVSLVTNYREAFNQEVRANGVDGVIQMLSNKNKQLESGKK